MVFDVPLKPLLVGEKLPGSVEHPLVITDAAEKLVY